MPCALKIFGGVAAQITSIDECDSPCVVPTSGDIRLRSTRTSIEIEATNGSLVLVLPSDLSLTEIIAVGGAALVVHDSVVIKSTLSLIVGEGSTVFLSPRIDELDQLQIHGAGTVCCAGGQVITQSLSVQSACQVGLLLQVSGIRVLKSMQTTLTAKLDCVHVSANRSAEIVTCGATQPFITLADDDDMS